MTADQKRIEELRARHAAWSDSEGPSWGELCEHVEELFALASELAEKLAATEAERDGFRAQADGERKGYAISEQAHAETKRELERERKTRGRADLALQKIRAEANGPGTMGQFLAVTLSALEEVSSPPPPVSPVAEQPVEMGTGEERCGECQDGQALGGNGPSRCAYCGRGC